VYRAGVEAIADLLLHGNVQRFRGGLVCKAHRRLHHSGVGVTLIKLNPEPDRRYDEGSAMIKLGKEQPVASMDQSSGKVNPEP